MSRRKPRWGRIIAAAAVLTAIIIAVALLITPKAHAELDRYFPFPPTWCPGGGTSTGWGGYCDGQPYPDGSKWHQDSFVAPFVGRVWNPIVCVVANAPAPPPLATWPGACGGFVA